ncbi:hypothetical protein HA402_004699 [Bradysia odoriphaga]|nr:hypothetical protein HA402_004699 [Bradysia odoriphaga]
MEENEFRPAATRDMDKCAIIYRSNSVSFVYVCFHCGSDFNNIDSTLKHIESHFQLEQITIDEKSVKSEFTDFENASDDTHETDNFCDATEPAIQIKTEVMEADGEYGTDAVERPTYFNCKRCASTFSSKFSCQSHTVKVHFKEPALECGKCGKTFKRDASIKNHLRQHIDRGEVDWKCEGDGIREPNTVLPKQQEEGRSSIELKSQPEKRKLTKRNSLQLLPEKQEPENENAEKQKPEKRKTEKSQPVKTEKPVPEKRKAEKQKPEKRKSEKSTPDKEEKPKPDKAEKPAKQKAVKQKPDKATKPEKEEKVYQLSTYICHKCSDTYNTSTDLNEHLKLHSTGDILQINKCKECKIFYQSAFDLRLHVLEIHLSIKDFKCSTCLIEFKKEDKDLLEKHLELHLANNSTKWVNIRHGICNNGLDATNFEEITTTAESCCDLCEEKFYLKANLAEHARCMHWDNESKLRCPKCEAVFTKNKNYFAHQLEHRRSGEDVIETDMKVLLANLNSYIDEQFVCNEVENASSPYKCLICNSEKVDLSKIKSHVREQHVYKTLPQPIKPILKEKIACNLCGMLITRNSFRTHFLAHVDAKKYPCSFCGRVFSKNYSKKTHERMHTGEKPFQCDQCGKRFFSNSLLGAHKQAHDNTTYPCKICGRVFNISSGYRRHMQTHRKDQSFECTICGKSFNARVYLKRHLNKHNAKTFQCSFCENKFNTEKGQRQHEKTQHNHEPPI